MKKATLVEPDLLTTAEVATLLRQPVSTIRYWRQAGTGPAWVKVGRRVLYERHDVLEWYEQRYRRPA